MTERSSSAPASPVTTLFLDIGGVLLSNGWDETSRTLAVKTFGLDGADLESRHQTNVEILETGKLSLDEYLRRVVFHEPRSFSPAEFKSFMFAQSQPKPEMLAFVRELKARRRLKIVVVSNEGRELTLHRIAMFKLGDFVDFFVSSCFVGLRKPDEAIYRLALDLVPVAPAAVIYIDDRALLIELASGFGLNGICHRDVATTRRELGKRGVTL